MTKKLFRLFACLILVMAIAVPASAGMKDMWAKVYSWDGKMSSRGQPVLTEISSGVTFVVMQRNTIDTLETLYYYDDDTFSSLTNPVTGTNFASDTVCNDQVQFRVDPGETSDTYVDLIVVDQAGGYTAFVEDFDENTHTIVIDERMNIRHHGVAFIGTIASSTETDTGIDFDDVSIIDKMMIEIGTAFPTNSNINVGILSSGTNGDADGFIYDAGIATVGFNNPLRSGVDLTSYSVTSSEAYGVINAGAAGTFLGHIGLGSGDTQTLIPQGMIVPDQLLIHGTWENSLTYTFPTTAASTGWGMIHYWFTRIR